MREAIRDIVADADAAYGDGALWPADEWDAWQTPTPLKALYVGAAGVVWALDALRRRGHAETRLDLAAAARSTLERWSSEPDLMRGVELPEPARAGLLSGQAGILAVSYRVDPSDEVADELFERARENVRSTATGVMWGSPGTLLAARAMLDWTGEERWAEVWRDSATALLAARDADGLWEQWLYGERFLGLIPLYGLVGNVLALLGGSDLLGENTLAPEAAAVLRRTAMQDEGLANWPSSAGERPRQDDASPGLQWCVGGPGHRRLRGRVPGRGPASRRGQDDLASGAARGREGRRPLSRHGRERLRAPEDVREDVRRALARAGPFLRGSRARAGRPSARNARPWPVFALDGRSRRGALRRRLPRSPSPVSDPGDLVSTLEA